MRVFQYIIGLRMGFEQLASLRDQLAQQAAAEKAKKQEKKKQHQAPSADVDPVVQTIGQLQKRFPTIFPKSPNPKVPLKIGIHNDLVELSEQLGIAKEALLEAIKTWCTGNRYWACMVEGAIRVDLNGNEAGRVTKDNAVQAQRLKYRSQKKKPKKTEAKPVRQAPATE